MNSPAIRHRKKHWQSQPVVSWLSEAVESGNGTKLRTIHRPASSSARTDSIDYIGNLILKNGQPSMYLLEGGYASFGT